MAAPGTGGARTPGQCSPRPRPRAAAGPPTRVRAGRCGARWSRITGARSVRTPGGQEEEVSSHALEKVCYYYCNNIFQVTTLARPTMMTGAPPGTAPLEAGRPVRGQGAEVGPQGREGAAGHPRSGGAETGSRERPEVTMVTPRPFTMSDLSPYCRLINCSIVLCIIKLLSTLLYTVSTSIFLNTLQHPRIYRVNFILGYFKYMYKITV